MQASSGARRTTALEKVLALLGLVYSTVVTLRLWLLIAANQEMWPFPALYLIEVVLLPGIVVALVLRGRPRRTSFIAGMAGALLAFSILGAWSVGFFYLPLVVLLIALVALSRRSSGDRLSTAAVSFLIGALVQVVTMLAPLGIESPASSSGLHGDPAPPTVHASGLGLKSPVTSVAGWSWASNA